MRNGMCDHKEFGFVVAKSGGNRHMGFCGLFPTFCEGIPSALSLRSSDLPADSQPQSSKNSATHHSTGIRCHNSALKSEPPGSKPQATTLRTASRHGPGGPGSLKPMGQGPTALKKLCPKSDENDPAGSGSRYYVGAGRVRRPGRSRSLKAPDGGTARAGDPPQRAKGVLLRRNDQS